MLWTQGCYRLFWEANLSDSSGAWMADVKDATKVSLGPAWLPWDVLHSVELSAMDQGAQFWMLTLLLQSPCIVDIVDMIGLLIELLILLQSCWSSGCWFAVTGQDVDVQLLFNNAGFIVTGNWPATGASKNMTIFQLHPHLGSPHESHHRSSFTHNKFPLLGLVGSGFFEQHSVDTHLANFHCNLTANIHLTHHFYSLMINKARLQSMHLSTGDSHGVACSCCSWIWIFLCSRRRLFPTQGLKGCIVFTSSSAGFIPNPFAAMCLWRGRGWNSETTMKPW